MTKKDQRASASDVRTLLKALREKTGWAPSDIIGLLRGGGTASKGSDYERQVCVQLSRWWSGGDRDDIFWRSPGSGARATTRHRRGDATAGQHGDVVATDAVGADLTAAVTIELKRGYNEHTAHDLLDRPVGGGVQLYERFFAQAVESHEAAGTVAWLLVTKRDRRQAMCWMPCALYQRLREAGAFPSLGVLIVRMVVPVRLSDGAKAQVDAVGVPFDHFLLYVTPEHIRTLR